MRISRRPSETSERLRRESMIRKPMPLSTAMNSAETSAMYAKPMGVMHVSSPAFPDSRDLRCGSSRDSRRHGCAS